MRSTRQDQTLTPAAFHILLALAPRDLHGYGIMQEAEAISDGAIRLAPGTLYRTLKRLLEDGLIEEVDERPDPELDDERRRYYRLTGQGRHVMQEELRRLESLVSRAKDKHLLEPGPAFVIQGA